MIFGTIKLAYRLVTLTILLYVFFGVPIGERTLFQHVVRIASTDEAKELGRELREAGAKAGAKVGEQIEEGLVAPGDDD
ncbi:MAG: hypothetical protein GXY23_03410 [Myxococcales bacterium]|nr:hypothetical protein [Myxococcales bacterium]